VPEKRGKILVIRGGAIGDFILTLPAISALRTTFPDTNLDLLAYPQMAELARASGVIDSFRSIEARALAGFFARKGNLDPELSLYFEGVSLVISYLYDPDEFFKLNFGRVSKAQFIQAAHRPNELESTHATDVFLKPLEQLAIFDVDREPRLKIEPEKEILEACIAVHPGSGSEKKNWSVEHWTVLIRDLAERGEGRIMVVGGEADADRLAQLRLNLIGRNIEFLQERSLLKTARALSGCKGFIGHDSGITHLACALNLPALVLWGPSKQQIWRPLSAKARVISHAAGLNSLDPETVRQQFESLLGQ
jgi:heptosyltransferase-2